MVAIERLEAASRERRGRQKQKSQEWPTHARLYHQIDDAVGYQDDLAYRLAGDGAPGYVAWLKGLIAGKPGSYNAVAHLRPWLQMEELTTSMRMVARIPQKT